jgi:hypothetical protein
MIILSEITDRLQVVLAGSVTTNQLSCMASWRDVTTTTFTPGRSLVVTNNTTDVNIVSSPTTDTQRIIDFLSIYNADTVNATVTIKLDVNGTDYTLWRGILGTGEMLQYNDKSGFTCMTIAGAIKQSQMWGSNNPAINSLNVVVLAADVTNNNATANTIADVTGLSFAVTAGQTYWFEFVIPYTAAATTTGSRWSISGPGSPTMLNYRSEYTLTATTTTVNSATAYDIPAASNASSLTTGDVATIWGIIRPSGDGVVIARFASEISASAIVAKAGATLRWMRII